MCNKVLCLINLVIINLGLLSCTRIAPANKPPTVGIINSIDLIGDPTVEGFKAGMTDLGYIEGETIVYDVQVFALGEDEQVAAAVQEMVARPVDLIYAIGVPAADAAQQATAEQPIPVLFLVNDPVASGYVDSLRQPSGNMTGVTAGSVAADSDGRRLEWLKRIKPDLSQVYVTHNPDDAGMVRNLKAFQAEAAQQNVEVVVDVLSSQAEVDAAMANLPEDMEVFFLLSDRRLSLHLPGIIEQSLERKFIVSTPVLNITRLGGLMAFAADFGLIGEQTAHLADQVLKGADPGTLPVEEPEIVLNVNLKTAETIGVEIPDEVLEAAYEIIRE